MTDKTTTKQPKAPSVDFKRLVSACFSFFVGLVAFMFIWCAVGMAMQHFEPTLHPGYWMATGYFAGAVGINAYEIVAKKVRKIFRH